MCLESILIDGLLTERKTVFCGISSGTIHNLHQKRLVFQLPKNEPFSFTLTGSQSELFLLLSTPQGTDSLYNT